MVNRDGQNAMYIANMIKSIEENKRALCTNVSCCEDCSLGTFNGLFDARLCDMLIQTKKRLEFSYKLVETL